MLLDAGAHPDLDVEPAGTDDLGFTLATPLMGAALNGNLEVLQLLLARGADVDAVGNAGYDDSTAFHQACEALKGDCAEALLRAGA